MTASLNATIAPARRCAFVVLRRTFEQGAYTDQALRAEARGLDARDRALAMRLATGAVQRKGTLDHFIERLAERPAERLDAPFSLVKGAAHSPNTENPAGLLEVLLPLWRSWL